MIRNYIKIAWKVLRRRPFYTFVNLFGISLTLTILMVITAFLEHLLGAHYPEQNRDRTLYVMNSSLEDKEGQMSMSGPLSYKFATQLCQQLTQASKYALGSIWENTNAYANGRQIKLALKYTDASFWDLTTFTFLEGKAYTEDDVANGRKVMVITDAIRDAYFGRGLSVVGKTMEIDNDKFQVCGVVKGAPITRPLTYGEVFQPLTMPKSGYKTGEYHGRFLVYIQVDNPAKLNAAQAEFNGLIDRMEGPFVDGGNSFSSIECSANTYTNTLLGTFGIEDGEQKVMLAMGIFFLLFISLPIVNLVNLTISRMMERASEIGVRRAFGATVGSLISQFLIENIFVTFLGGAISLVLAALIIFTINQAQLIPQAQIALNGKVLLASVLISLLFGIFSGIYPAIKMARTEVVQVLHSR